MSPAVVEIWWAPLAAARPQFARLLDPAERARYAAFRFADDAARFLLGAVLVRLVTAARLGLSPARVLVDRRCPHCDVPHGRVRLPGAGLHVSVTHGGAVVGVAACPTAAVGLDVEPRSRDCAGLAPDVLAAAELAAFLPTPPDRRNLAFLRYWTRKEAVVKATGDGLRASLSRVVVTPPDQPAALLGWHGRPGLARVLSMADPSAPGPQYLAALAVLSPVHRLTEHDAADLIG